MDDLYPVTITRSRYSGGYEPGEWLAWPLNESNLPAGWAGDDVTCREFWDTYAGVVGSGATPQAAYDDLLAKIRDAE